MLVKLRSKELRAKETIQELRKEIAMRDEALTKKIDEKFGKLDGMQEEMKKIGQVVGELRRLS